MNQIFARLPCCGHNIDTVSDAMLTRALTHCLRAVVADPDRNIQLLVNLREAIQEIERRDLEPAHVADRIKALSATWDAGQDVF